MVYTIPTAIHVQSSQTISLKSFVTAHKNKTTNTVTSIGLIFFIIISAIDML
ncbi:MULTISPECIES: hypothetical protein [Bacillus]|uniref:hypothetical protein n=1 Tax=Bacillus TaxID=1386 RepID=UPI001596A6EF|nr:MULTISPECIES: hypothetical protein [Bacillus cereus group]